MKARVLVAALAIVASGWATSRAADSELDVRRARESWRSGQYAAALKEARRAVAVAPSSVEAHLTWGGFAESLGEFDEARAAYAKARALDPNSPEALHAIATLSARSGQYANALTFLEFIAASHPWQVRTAFLHGPLEVRRGLMREHHWLEPVIQLRIDILMETADLAGARALAREYGLVDPSRQYCEEVQQIPAGPESGKALPALRLATLAQPREAACVASYGRRLADEGYMRLARVMLLEATRVASSPDDKASAERYLRVRLSGGRETAKRAEQLSMIGRQRYSRDGDVDGAMRLLEEAVRIDPAFPRPYNHLARIAWNQGDRPASIRRLEQGLRADPDSWRTHRNLGKALAILGRLSDAESHLRKTVELFGDDVGGHLALARVLYAAGKYDAYVEHTRLALGVARSGQRDLSEVEAFMTEHQRSGPSGALPPAPDPALLTGWNFD